MEKSFLPTQTKSENLRGKSCPVNKRVALSLLCATHTQEVLLQFERFLFSFSSFHVNIGLGLCGLQEDGMKHFLAGKQLEGC